MASLSPIRSAGVDGAFVFSVPAPRVSIVVSNGSTDDSYDLENEKDIGDKEDAEGESANPDKMIKVPRLSFQGHQTTPIPVRNTNGDDPPSARVPVTPLQAMHSAPVNYRLYRMRFVGVFGLVMLNVVAGMNWPWFGPIANSMTQDFNVSLERVNWLGNVINVIYLPVSLIVPIMVAKWGIQRSCFAGAITLVIASWVRYAGTIHSLNPNQAYPLLMVGQILVGLGQPIFQVLGPKYSETWFDLKGRTTATMVIAIANPIGGAIGQLISPLVGSTRFSILILGIISSTSVGFALLVRNAPPTPPTFAGSVPSPPLMETVRALIGRPRPAEQRLEWRDRLDFLLLCMSFGVLVAGTNAFSLLTNEIFAPVGYSEDEAGLMGAALLLAGIVAAVVSAPLFDRVLCFYLGRVIKCLVPFLAAAWISLIWAVRPNDTIALFLILVLIGAMAVTLLPVALELGCEVTRNAEASSAILWFSGNLWCFIFVIVEGALRAGPDANPPLNMRNALIFNGAMIGGISSFMVFFRGRQSRREMDLAAQKKEDSDRDDDDAATV